MKAPTSRIGSLLAHALKQFFIAFFRLTFLLIAWLLKITSLICSRASSLIERIIIKRS
jgi:hypothetical protein